MITPRSGHRAKLLVGVASISIIEQDWRSVRIDWMHSQAPSAPSSPGHGRYCSAGRAWTFRFDPVRPGHHSHAVLRGEDGAAGADGGCRARIG
jgi:hypothetical protein